MRLRSFPKVAETTLESVRVDSARFWPLRMTSCRRSHIQITLAASITVSVAALLVMLPAALVTTTVKLDPVSALTVAGVV